MKISIITPCFNSEKTISKTISSVINQIGNFEIDYIIIDGESTDKTLTILKGFQRKILSNEHPIRCLKIEVVIISEKDNGVYDAMNKGLSMAQGEYVYFLGSDDFLASDNVLQSFIFYLKQKVKKSDKIAMFYGDVFNLANNVLKRQPRSTLLFSYLNICHQAIFYNRELLILCGGYNTNYSISADHASNLQLWNKGHVYMPIEICKYGGKGISSFGSDSEFLKQRNNLIKSNLGWSYFLLQLFIGKTHLLVRSFMPKSLYPYFRKSIFKR